MHYAAIIVRRQEESSNIELVYNGPSVITAIESIEKYMRDNDPEDGDPEEDDLLRNYDLVREM